MEGGKTFLPVLPFSQMFQRKINYHNSQSIFQPITKRVESLTVHNQFRIVLITLNACQPKSNNAIYNRGSIALSFRESAPPVPYTWKDFKSKQGQTKLIKFHNTQLYIPIILHTRLCNSTVQRTMKAANNTEIRLALEKLKYFQNDQHVVTNDTKKKKEYASKAQCSDGLFVWSTISLQNFRCSRFSGGTFLWHDPDQDQ